MKIKLNKKTSGILLLFAETILLVILFSVMPNSVLAVIGTPNATPESRLNVGNSFPELQNVSIEEDAATFALTANSTKEISCVGVIVDFNGETDLYNFTSANLYDATLSSDTDPDDNNTHYTNSSCPVQFAFGSFNGYSDDVYTAIANCTFQVEYYTNPGTWTCNMTANDSSGGTDRNFDQISIDELLAVGLPDSINYGLINATAVSGENESNVTNLGNVDINLSLEGYGFTEGDGNAMNCTLGSIGNISIEHEKFNLTGSNTSNLNLAETNSLYTNLSADSIVYDYDLVRRTNDTFNDAFNSTYWRIYVPEGVGGTCTGNIIFGATTANGI